MDSTVNTSRNDDSRSTEPFSRAHRAESFGALKKQESTSFTNDGKGHKHQERGHGTSDHGRNLFVENVSSEMSPAEMRQIFECFGEVVAHKIMIDMRTALRRDFGFVLYRHQWAAQQAVEALDGFIAYGKALRVRVADTDTRQPGEPSQRVTIRYLPATISKQDIHRLVSQAGVEPERIETQPDTPSTLTLALVVLKTPVDAQCVADTLHRRVMLLSTTPGVSRKLRKKPVSVKVAPQDYTFNPRSRAPAENTLHPPPSLPVASLSSLPHQAKQQHSRRPTQPPHFCPVSFTPPAESTPSWAVQPPSMPDRPLGGLHITQPPPTQVLHPPRPNPMPVSSFASTVQTQVPFISPPAETPVAQIPVVWMPPPQ